MPFVHSMLDGAENTVSGELLVSTFGGGTSNTEFEFLTGSSMGFLPYGTTPYQVYLRSDTPGLVSGLAKQGYARYRCIPIPQVRGTGKRFMSISDLMSSCMILTSRQMWSASAPISATMQTIRR